MARRKASGLYQRNGRYYLAWYLPGHGMQHLALIPTGETRATTNLDVAETLRAHILTSGLTAKEITAARRGGEPTPRKPRRAGDEAELPAQVEKALSDFEEYNADKASAAHAKRNVAKVRAFLAGQGISDLRTITPKAIDAHLTDQRGEKLSASTRRAARAALSRFCGFLVVQGVLPHNPVRDVPGPSVKLPPPRFLNPDKYEKACGLAKDAGIWPEFATALWTGMRRGELRVLDWPAVQWATRQIVLLKTKTNRPRSIPMKADLIVALEEHALVTTGQAHPKRGLMFHDGHGKLRPIYWWLHALDPLRDKIPVFREVTGTGSAWHLLRHTFASRLVQAGVPLRQVAEWLGHSSVATTMRYAHLQPAYDAQVEHA